MTFKLAATVLAFASFTAATGSSMAATAPFSVGVGDAIHPFGFTVGAAPAVGTWQFSDSLMGAMGLASADATSVSPGHVSASGDLRYMDSFQVDMPLARVGGVVDEDAASVSVNRVAFGGGVHFEIPGRSTGKKNIASLGGSLTLSDIQIDFGTHAIYATLEGGNNVGLKQNVHLLDYGVIEGLSPIACYAGMDVGPCAMLNAAGVTLSYLTVTAEGLDLIGTSMGLNSIGLAAMRGVDEYGTFTIARSPVPEVSASWLMLTGLAVLGLGSMTRRARAG